MGKALLNYPMFQGFIYIITVMCHKSSYVSFKPKNSKIQTFFETYRLNLNENYINYIRDY